MIRENLKEKSFSIDIDSLLKKTIEGRNLTVLFETELQKKLVDPLFKKISDTVSETEINIKSTNLTNIVDDAFSNISLDKNAVSRLNTAYSDKINNIITNINGINIENIRKDFEQNVDKQFKDKFNSVKLEVPEKLKTNNLLSLLTENEKDNNTLVKYKLISSTIDLVDKISSSVKNLNIDIKKNLKIKDLVDLLISPNKNFNNITKDRYNNIINSFLDNLNKGTTAFAINSAPLIPSDIFSILFEKDADTVSFAKKRYEQILNTLTDKITVTNELNLKSDKDTYLQKNTNTADNLADYNSNIQDAIFTTKELSLSADTLKQLKLDNSYTIKENDLATNAAQEINTRKLLSSFEEMKTLLEELGENLQTKSNDNSSIFDLIKNFFAKPTKPTTSRSPRRQQNQNANRSAQRQTGRQTTTRSQAPRNNTRTSPQRLTPQATTQQPTPRPTTPPSSNQPAPTPRADRQSIPRQRASSVAKASKALKVAGAIGTVANVGVAAYNYNEVDKLQKQNVITKQEAITEKSKIVGETSGGLAGAAAGAYTGAVLGSLAGPVGTLVGSIIGSIAGGMSGSSLGEKAGARVADKYLTPEAVNNDKLPTTAPVILEEKINQPPPSSTKEPSVNITQPTTQTTQPSLPSNAELKAPTSLPAVESINRPIESLKVTAIESTRQDENFAKAAFADFNPLISFLDTKFEILGTGIIALAGAISNNSAQSPINIINNQEEEQSSQFNMQSPSSYSSSESLVNVIEATRAAYRNL